MNAYPLLQDYQGEQPDEREQQRLVEDALPATRMGIALCLDEFGSPIISLVFEVGEAHVIWDMRPEDAASLGTALIEAAKGVQ